MLLSPQLRVQPPSHGSCLHRNTESKPMCPQAVALVPGPHTTLQFKIAWVCWGMATPSVCNWAWQLHTIDQVLLECLLILCRSWESKSLSNLVPSPLPSFPLANKKWQEARNEANVCQFAAHLCHTHVLYSCTPAAVPFRPKTCLI